jgi:solute:Na+ symporter, SSS family
MISGIDFIIIICYFIVVMSVGIYVSKRASSSIDEYFLGGRRFPWYILGLVGMATYFDMSGTMFQVSYFYLLGVKGYWVCFEGGLALFLAFLMIFMGKWLNRSKCMTNSELISLRFGKDTQGQFARLVSASAVLVLAIAFLSYFFVGAAKFLPIYVPVENISPNVIALIFFMIVGVYTIASGFHGVVYTDIIQAILIFIIVIFIATKALIVGTPEYFAQFTNPEWHQIIPKSWSIEMPVGYEHMQLLGVLIIAWVIANVFQGFAIPLDAWTSQKFYAAKDPRESSLIAGQWVSLFSLRFLLMMGMGVLAVGIAEKIAEPELALPVVILELVPIGMKGLLIAAIIAAAMSTVDGFLNSSAAYFVNDIYKEFIRKKASTKNLVKMSYITTAVILIVGVLIGWKVKTIDSIWGWIIMGLLTGTLPPNIVKWFWWRFNGVGFASGMGAGIIAAILYKLILTNAPPFATFAFVMAISSIGTILGTYLGKPTDMETLVKFYKKIRPFGFWQPVRELCEPELVNDIKKENKHDLRLLGPACIWQVMLFWLMTAIVAQKWASAGGTFVVVAFLSFILYKYWYKRLKTE